MYGSGSGLPVLVTAVPVVAGVTTAAVLPQTGANLWVEVALVAVVTLVVWAVMYIARAKFTTR